MVDLANTLLIPALVAGATYALVATGFNVLERTTGVLNFAHGNLITWAPLGVLMLAVNYELPVVVAFVLSALLLLVMALVEERIAIRPFIQSHQALPWVLTTLGVGIILTELSVIPFQGEIQSFRWHLGYEAIEFGGIQVTPVALTVIVTALVTVGALSLLYRRTRLGRMLEAVAEDLDGAEAIGISARRMSQLAAALAGLVALVTGWVVAPIFLVDPDLGLRLTFTGFVAAAIGGLGSLGGGLIGGLVVGLVIQSSSVYLGSLWVNPALFGILLAVYLIRPTGLFGKRAVRLV